jgi:hypothetical protein
MAGAVATPIQTRRLPRGAVFAFASSVAVVGCSSSDPTPQPDAGDGAVTETINVPVYGAPADTSVVDDMGTIDAAYGAPVDTGGGAPLYGAAPDP